MVYGGAKPLADGVERAKTLAVTDFLIGDLGIDINILGKIEKTFRPRGENPKNILYVKFNNVDAAEIIIKQFADLRITKESGVMYRLYIPP